MSRSRGSLDPLKTQWSQQQYFIPPVLLPYCLHVPQPDRSQWISGTWVKYVTVSRNCKWLIHTRFLPQELWHGWEIWREIPNLFHLTECLKSLWKLATVKLHTCPEYTLLKNRRLTERIVSILKDGLKLQLSWGCVFFGRQLSHGFPSPSFIAFWLCKRIFAICCSGLIRVVQCPYMDHWQACAVLPSLGGICLLSAGELLSSSLNHVCFPVPEGVTAGISWISLE